MRVYGLRIGDDGAIRYVGITKNSIEQRLKGHRTNLRTPVSKWIKKHGKHNVRAVLLEECETEVALVEAEVRWIAKLRAEGGDLLNVHPGGRYSPARKHVSEETKALLRAAHAGRPVPQERREAISKALTGRKKSPETIERIRQAALNRKPGGGMTGKKHSPETRAKMTAAQFARYAKQEETE